MKGGNPNKVTKGLKKSDRVIVVTKSANKGGSPPAERVERRTPTKSNQLGRNTRCTQRQVSVTQTVQLIREAARKEDGTTRPLGIASLEDKIVQKAVSDVILTPIFEEDFYECSYGFRPGRGAHQALDAVALAIGRRKVNWILDCDVSKFFDNVDRDWLIKFLEHRIQDKRVIRLIQKWLNAGVMTEDGVRDSGKGTPQGGLISPILANIYLHYALDVWVDYISNPRRMRGEAHLVRYADDFVVGVQYRGDAESFFYKLKERLGKFSLSIHPKKTRLIEFGRFAASNRAKRKQKKPETFNFLGMTHYCSRTRSGKFALRRKPMARTLRAMKDSLRRAMHSSAQEQGLWLGQVYRGWLQYYAVPGSFRYLARFRERMIYDWYKTLRRRSQRTKITWEKTYRYAELFIPTPRIVHPWPGSKKGR